MATTFEILEPMADGESIGDLWDSVKVDLDRAIQAHVDGRNETAMHFAQRARRVYDDARECLDAFDPWLAGQVQRQMSAIQAAYPIRATAA